MLSFFRYVPFVALPRVSHLDNLPASAASAGQFAKFSDKPVVILSARTAPEHRRREHAAMAARLPQGEHVLAGDSNHWIMQEQPEMVIRAIEKVAKRVEKFMAQPL
jgi:pimeloyl-ACP methyl ester carboxylesterase